MTEETPHILMSVSKSMLGLLVHALKIDTGIAVTQVIPETRGTAYEDATLRHLLDMRTAIAFDEDYLATSGPIIEYRKATGWNPVAPGEPASDLHSFYAKLNPDLLGWVIEHATGMCATLRDLARVGQWMIETQAAFLQDLERNGEREAWAAGEYYPGLPIRYRSQWYLLDGETPLAFGMGIHGQNLFVDRAGDVVIAKLSSQAVPLDAARMALTMRAVADIRALLGRR